METVNSTPRFSCFLLVILLAGIISGAKGQKQLTGCVTDTKGVPIFAANVYLKHAPTKGVTTDFQGAFLLPAENKSSHDTLIVSFVGFKRYAGSLDNLPTPLIIKLHPSIQQLGEAVIKARDPISESFAVSRMEPMDIYMTPSASGDPLKALTSMAASTNVEETANPSLRGAHSARSRVMLNRVPIYQPVRNSQINGMGNFSLFNPEIIDKQYIYASNPPLTYGNASGGLVEINTRNTLPYNQLQLSTTLASAGAFLSQNTGKNGFLQFYSNHQFDEAFTGLNRRSLSHLKSFNNTDAGLNLHHQLGEHWQHNTFVYAIDETYKVENRQFAYTNKAIGGKKRLFSVHNLKYYSRQFAISLNIGTDKSLSSYDYGTLHSEQQNARYYGALDYTFLALNNSKLQTGINWQWTASDFQEQIPVFYYAPVETLPTYAVDTVAKHQFAEGYLYYTLIPNLKWKFSTGLRSNLYASTNMHYLSYQASACYKPAAGHHFLLSAGKYHNYAPVTSIEKETRLMKSMQIALDYSYSWHASEIGLAVYYSQTDGLPPSYYLPQTENETTLGLEAMIKGAIGEKGHYSLAYTYLNQKYDINNRSTYTQLDMNYFIKASFAYQIPILGALSATFSTRPGLRYTPIDAGSELNDRGIYLPQFNETNSKRYNNYANLTMGYSRYMRHPRMDVLVFANCTNIFNRKNQSHRYFSNNYSQIHFDYYSRRTLYLGLIVYLHYK